MVQKSTKRHEKTASLKQSRSSRQIKKIYPPTFRLYVLALAPFPNQNISKKKVRKLPKKLSAFFPFQSISMTIKTGKAVYVIARLPKNTSTGLESLFNFQMQMPAA